MLDFLIVGGGIIGSALARELAQRKAGRIALVDKEDALGRHTSARNSGVVHSGIGQPPGSLRARFCIEGSRRLLEHCRRSGVPILPCGTLVAARDEAEERVVTEMLEIGREAGVEGLRLLSSREFSRAEPACSARAALSSPSGAMVDSAKFLDSVAQDARSLGVEFHLRRRVDLIDDGAVSTESGPMEARNIVNCAGLQADRLAHRAGTGLEYRIVPFLGLYSELRGCEIRGMVFLAPDPRLPFPNIHLCRRTDGRVLAGPLLGLALGRENYDGSVALGDLLETVRTTQFRRLIGDPSFRRLAWRGAKARVSGAAMLAEVRSVAPKVVAGQLTPAHRVIRAQAIDERGRMADDIVLRRHGRALHVFNAVIAGMTCSLALAEHLADGLLDRAAVLGAS